MYLYLVPCCGRIIMLGFRKKFPKEMHVNWLIAMIFGGHWLWRVDI